MKQKKLILVLMIIVFIFIVFQLIILILLNKKNVKSNTINQDGMNDNIINNSIHQAMNNIEREEDIIIDENVGNDDSNTPYIISTQVKKVINKIEYYTVKRCVEIYVSYVQSKNQEAVAILLDDAFKENKQITNKNVMNKIESIAPNELITIKSMYQKEVNENSTQYFVEGILRQYNNSQVKEKSIFLTVVLNNENQKYSIIPGKESFPIELQNLKIVNKTYTMQQTNTILENSEKISESILENGSGKGEYFLSAEGDTTDVLNINSFSYVNNITDATITRDYLIDFKQNCRYDIERAYASLNQEYKTKRFGSIEAFSKFLEENLDCINEITLKQYRVYLNEQYKKEYDCIDQNNNNFIFQENAIMDYELFLDTYTIETDIFKEKYHDATEEEKARSNIIKIMNAMYMKDYAFIYEKLDSDFKNSYYISEDLFKKFMEQNLYKIMTYSIVTIEYDSNTELVYVELEIKDAYNLVEANKNMQIIMKLGDNTDFTMSFNIDS